MTAVPGAAWPAAHSADEPAPLDGLRVLVARPAGHAEELVAALRAVGAHPVHVPLIATTAMTESAALRAAIPALAVGDYDWVAFTSAAAVDALRATATVVGKRGGGGVGGAPVLRVADRTRIAAVGAATAAALREAGLPVHLLPEGPGSATSLAAALVAALVAGLPAEASGSKVLLPCSDRAAPTLADALRCAGHDVTVVHAYRTEILPVPGDLVRDLAAGSVDAVLLTSPSTAYALAAAPLAPGARLVAIGEPTARAARDAGLAVAAVAAQPSNRGLVDALVQAYGHDGAAAPDTAGSPTTTSSTRTVPSTKTASSKKEVATMPFPVDRPRRLRRTPALRRLVAETRMAPADLILPMFVREGIDEPQPIASMPGVVQHTLDTLRAAAADAVDAGVGGLMLFGVPAHRDAVGSGATEPAGILNTAIAALHTDLGDATVLMADLCLDEFTDHGHCGVLAPDGSVDNDATLLRYADMGIALADAGADMVGTSGMMDGQVAAVRAALDGSGHADTGIIGYAAKYASACYGPFREAVDSQLVGDRRTYQQDPANAREALREVDLDIAEGADIVIVKPAGWYLDVLAATAARSSVPVAAYQVSGEYAMITAAAQQGWIDRDVAIAESLTAIRRAGADMILTYWAAEMAAKLGTRRP